MSSTKTIVVFGSGPGIGNHVAKEFASNGFTHVILLARNESRLQEDKAWVAEAGSHVKVDTLRLDLSDTSSIPTVLGKIDDLVGGAAVDVIFFNAARVKTSEPLTTPVEEIEEDFKTTNLALYVIAQHFIPKLQKLAQTKPQFKPSLLVTNSHLPWDPIPSLLSLSLIKASQANMVESLSRAFSDSGIHVGLVHVEGTVEPHLKYLNPKNIAEVTYGFFESGEGLGAHIKE